MAATCSREVLVLKNVLVSVLEVIVVSVFGTYPPCSATSHIAPGVLQCSATQSTAERHSINKMKHRSHHM